MRWHKIKNRMWWPFIPSRRRFPQLQQISFFFSPPHIFYEISLAIFAEFDSRRLNFSYFMHNSYFNNNNIKYVYEWDPPKNKQNFFIYEMKILNQFELQSNPVKKQCTIVSITNYEKSLQYFLSKHGMWSKQCNCHVNRHVTLNWTVCFFCKFYTGVEWKLFENAK